MRSRTVPGSICLPNLPAARGARHRSTSESRRVQSGSRSSLCFQPLRSEHLTEPERARSATDAVLVANDERELVDANDAACELLGFARDELLELRIDDITSPEFHDLVERMWLDFLAQRHLSGVFAVRTAAGETVAVHLAALADFPVPGIHLSRLRRLKDAATPAEPVS